MYTFVAGARGSRQSEKPGRMVAVGRGYQLWRSPDEYVFFLSLYYLFFLLLVFFITLCWYVFGDIVLIPSLCCMFTVSSLLQKLKQQAKEQMEQRRPNLVKALKQMGDFYMEFKWDFQSWGKFSE